MSFLCVTSELIYAIAGPNCSLKMIKMILSRRSIQITHAYLQLNRVVASEIIVHIARFLRA
jgi:hypothetical protein